MHATATLAVLFIALYSGHVVADHWVQTAHQAIHKGDSGWPGRIACAAHVATYTLTQLAAVAVVATRVDLHTSPTRLAAGLAVSAITHYVADRRAPLRRMAAWCGKLGMYELRVSRPATPAHQHPFVDNYGPGTGAYGLDQSWHVAWLLISALVMV